MRDEIIAETREELIQRTADAVCEVLEQAIAADGKAVLAVAGGTSPEGLYRELAKRHLRWSQVTVTLTDERWVAADHADSNEANVRHWLLRGKAAEAFFLPLKTPAATPGDALIDQDEVFVEQAPMPTVVILGMGDDGHFASWFPHAPELKLGLDVESTAICMAAADPQGRGRLSLSLSWFVKAKHVFIYAPGKRKQQVMDAAMAGPEAFDFAAMPIRAVLFQDHVPVTLCRGP